ncbi:MAG TPA: hypothetical protein VF491_10655 [Vicinamibacterales bacterium]|jgi:hypothetical protein
MLRVALAGLLIVHGVAHLPGFAVPWQLMHSAEMPYTTTLLAGRFDVGDGGIRAVGVIWAALAVSFIALSLATWLHAPAARGLIVLAVMASLAMCVLGWPDARIGIAANLAVLVLLAIAR